MVDGFSSFETVEKEGNNGMRIVESFEPYLKFFINFLQIDPDGPATLLNPGEYSYRFEIKLPDNLPSSLVHGILGILIRFW